MCVLSQVLGFCSVHDSEGSTSVYHGGDNMCTNFNFANVHEVFKCFRSGNGRQFSVCEGAYGQDFLRLGKFELDRVWFCKQGCDRHYYRGVQKFLVVQVLGGRHADSDVITRGFADAV